MLAEQLGDLQAAEGHYEQHLALASILEPPDAPGPERAAAYASVMKVQFTLYALAAVQPVSAESLETSL